MKLYESSLYEYVKILATTALGMHILDRGTTQVTAPRYSSSSGFG
jgi:hypothetical protein